MLHQHDLAHALGSDPDDREDAADFLCQQPSHIGK
jgi:hypothetical protein